MNGYNPYEATGLPPPEATGGLPQSEPSKTKEESGKEQTLTNPGETDGTKENSAKSPDGCVPTNVKERLKHIIKGVSQKQYIGEYFPATVKDVKLVLKSVKPVFEAEPVLVECKLPVTVVGDLHGQYADLLRVFAMYQQDGTPGFLTQRYVFLGDYVDRGRQSVEILLLLFSLKAVFPTEFILLRGNHECRAINKAYGFFAELRERYAKKDAMYLFEMFNAVFNYMPLCCIVSDSIMCMHGGICPEMTSREAFNKIKKPIKDSNTHPIAASLLWSDPMIGEPNFRPNRIRGMGIHFGESVIDDVMTKLGVRLIVRGHQMMMNGFNFFSNNKLVTIFTAVAYYPDKPNNGAIMHIDSSGKAGFKLLLPAEKTGPKIFRGDHDMANQFDNGYQVNPDFARERMANKMAAMMGGNAKMLSSTSTTSFETKSNKLNKEE